MRKKGTAWTDEMTEELKTRRIAGDSATQIAMVMNCGMTRNMVIGKLWRLGMCKEKPVQSQPRIVAERPPRPRTARRRRGVSDQVRNAFGLWTSDTKRLTSPQPLSSDVHEVPTMRCIGIEDLTDKNCHWPLWPDDRKPFDGGVPVYCGAPAVDGCPYCGHHASIAYSGVGRMATWLGPSQ
jgi:GcrA cell cycle regulator